MATNPGMPVRHIWSESDRGVPRAMVQPRQRLMDHEAAGARLGVGRLPDMTTWGRPAPTASVAEDAGDNRRQLEPALASG